MVLLHYNGTGRRATDEAATRFFSGHWLYFRGTMLTRGLENKRTACVLHVSDTSVFSMKRYRIGVSDDIAIARQKVEKARTSRAQVSGSKKGRRTTQVARWP